MARLQKGPGFTVIDGGYRRGTGKTTLQLKEGPGPTPVLGETGGAKQSGDGPVVESDPASEELIWDIEGTQGRRSSS